jgi:fatty acid desaturase
VELPESDLQFVRRRAALVRAWPWVGTALLLVVVGLWGYWFFSGMLLANPWAVARGLERGTLRHDTAQTLALVGAVAFLAIGFLLLALILLLWAAMANERRLLRIIGTLRGGRGPID